MFRTNFLSNEQAAALASEHGTPLFVYSRGKLSEQVQTMFAVTAPYGLKVYYAMKANPHPEILKLFRDLGLGIDASSGYEAELAINLGFNPAQIILTSQQLAHNLKDLVAQGVQFNATSLRQLEAYGQLFPGSGVSVRINPGIGSGHSVKVTVGGPTSSFGIWHEYIPQVQEVLAKHNLTANRMHTHIGAGTDPLVWQEAARISLELIKNFPDADTINLGGGFKVARMDDESGADMPKIGEMIARELTHFAEVTDRQLKLELEPGTFMAANAGMLIAKIDDITDTGKDGYSFIKIDTGMNDILRPAMYGAQHPIAILNESSEQQDCVIVGHNCESADLLTPAPGDPEILMPRTLNKANIGDLVLIGGVGAYCTSMSAHGYNGYPSAKEIIVD
jgi:diaminopimelate decarboxylase